MKSTIIRHIELYGFLYLFAVLFLGAGFYFQPNLGGRGLFLPFNNAAWTVATFIICSAILISLVKENVTLPRGFLYILTAPLVIVVTGFFTDFLQPIAWFFRQAYVIGGVLFLFSLFQFTANEKRINQILILVCLSAYIHSLIGVFQIHAPNVISDLLPTNQNSIPSGIFQQINVQVTYLATGLVISLFLLSRPLAKSLKLIFLATIFAGTTSCTYIIIYSGSRVGILTLAISVTLLLFCRRKQLVVAKKQTITFIVAVCLGFLLAAQSPGIESVSKKTQEIAGGTNESIRLSMYSIAWELIKKKPIFGHGIGSYQRVWNQQTGEFHVRNPEAVIPPYVTHPHNELVFWLIEGGLVSIAGILLATITVVISLSKCGFQRGGGYFALLLPITLHSQVELPFYISSIHWFLWLFLIYMVLRHRTESYKIRLSKSANLLAKSITSLFLLVTIYFLYHSDRSQTDILNYVKQNRTNQPYLQTALSNLYFKHYAEELALRAQLYNGISTNNHKVIYNYIQWASKEIQGSPRLKLFEDLIAAYGALKEETKKCEIIRKGGFMYPSNNKLKQLAAQCPLPNNP